MSDASKSSGEGSEDRPTGAPGADGPDRNAGGTGGGGASRGGAGSGAGHGAGEGTGSSSGEQPDQGSSGADGSAGPGEGSDGAEPAGSGAEGSAETQAETQAGEQSEQGRIRFQDPESATPREPTLAERRARERAEQRRLEAEQAEREAAERASAKRRKLLIGSGVTVGVVALVAAFYSASSYSEQANASTRYCSTDQHGSTVAEREQFCDENYVNSHGGHVDHGTGMFFMPLFLPGGQRVMQPYRYGYTSGGAAAPAVGSVVGSPNFTQPSGTAVKGRDGSTISRGGFGFGKSSGGS